MAKVSSSTYVRAARLLSETRNGAPFSRRNDAHIFACGTGNGSAIKRRGILERSIDLPAAPPAGEGTEIAPGALFHDGAATVDDRLRSADDSGRAAIAMAS
jgi:hypothetical protein